MAAGSVNGLAQSAPIPISRGNWERFGKSTSITGTAAAADDDEAISKQRETDEFLKLARERFQNSVEAESRRREEMLTDLKFRCGIQWEEWVETKRRQQGRPSLTINRIPGFIKHVVNNMRQARPEIKVDPTGDGADEEIAEIRQGLIRHIWQTSRGDIAGDNAFELMCVMGLGYIRIVDDWDEASPFDKVLKVQWVPNTFNVYEDAAASLPDWSDGKYRFITEDLSLAEFKARFGADRQASSLSGFQSIGDHTKYWAPGGKIRIAEYFYIEDQEDEWLQFEDGTFALLSEIDPETETRKPIQTRPTTRPVVKWAMISGVDILKSRTWKGKYIPVIPVIGNQIELDGDRLIVGMVRYARESQRMYNYMYTSFVEAVALAPKAPFIAEFSQIEEFRDIWERANQDLVSILPYRGKSVDGNLLPAPQRQQAEPPIAQFIEGLKMADQNLKATFSIFEASLGQKGPQESGIAINSRKIESDLATYDWLDNYLQALQFTGIVLNDLLQYYYNTPGRIVQILREDDSLKPVTFNKEFQDGDKTKIYDLSKGKFSILIGTGPSAQTRRQESAKSMLDLAKVYPPLMQVAGPIIVKEMDWPGKDAIAAQLEKAMPPELRTKDPDAEQQGPDPEQLQQQLAQAAQMVQQLSQALNQANDETARDRMKEEWATLRTHLTQQGAFAVAELKTASEEAKTLNAELFAEVRAIRASLQPQMGEDGKPQSNSQAPAGPQAAAPQAPSAQAPPDAGSGPGGQVSMPAPTT